MTRRPAAVPAGAVAAVAAVLVLLPAAPAAGHADLEQSRPDDGAVVPEPPERVVLEFTEPLAARSLVTVRDGCDRDVAAELGRDGSTLTATVGDGQPGGWVVRYSVLSDVDGHPTEGTLRFSVDGTPECGAVPADDEEPEAAPADSPEDAESGLGAWTVAALAVAGVALLAGAVLARRAAR